MIKKAKKTNSKIKSQINTGVLVLENKKVFKGIGIGYQGEATGEICFNTSLTGYQEIISDPSYAGQIINFTVSTVGNPHGQGSENKYTSGRYLVTHLRHTFFKAPIVKHEVTMAITKDSYRTSLPSGSIETTTRPRGFVTEVTYGGDYGGM